MKLCDICGKEFYTGFTAPRGEKIEVWQWGKVVNRLDCCSWNCLLEFINRSVEHDLYLQPHKMSVDAIKEELVNENKKP